MAIEIVEDLIAELQKLNPKQSIRGYKWVSRWSGDPDDTDMSGYETATIKSVSEKKVGKTSMVYINIEDWMI